MSGSIRYVVGDATDPAERPAAIAHICNDVGGWGAGFVLALSQRWRGPEEAYRRWFVTREDFRLGAVQLVAIDDDLVVANMIAQHDITPKDGVPPIRYEALEEALLTLDEKLAPEASIHMPRIGCGLAGGTWENVSRVIADTLVASGREVVVYDPA